MNGIFESQGFRVGLHNLSLVSLFLAVGITLVAFVYYGRIRETEHTPPEDEKWVMLFATWRDSLIITLLFVAEGLVQRYAYLSGLSDISGVHQYRYAAVLSPILLFIADILTFIVAALRIIILSRWLNARVRRQD